MKIVEAVKRELRAYILIQSPILGEKSGIKKVVPSASRSQIRTSVSRDETYDFGKAEIMKELAYAMNNVEPSNTCISGKQTSDFEKVEVVKELACAIENIEGNPLRGGVTGPPYSRGI
jgi:hypothetical protein